VSQLIRLLGYAWALPITLVALVAYVLPFWALGWYTRLGKRSDALVWLVDAGRVPKWLLRLWLQWGGHAMGQVVVLKTHPDRSPHAATMLVHELEHVRQCMRLGIFQPVLYALCSLALLVTRRGHPYWDNCFEIDARRAAGQPIDIVGRKK
jgi:hypothetical protein